MPKEAPRDLHTPSDSLEEGAWPDCKLELVARQVLQKLIFDMQNPSSPIFSGEGDVPPGQKTVDDPYLMLTDGGGLG